MIPEPHGGVLQDLVLRDVSIKHDLQQEIASHKYLQLVLSERQLCDLELILNGGFSPLTGFLNQDDYESVVNTSRLTSGLLWPIPITLDVSEQIANGLKVGEKVVLKDLRDDSHLALLTVESIYKPDKQLEAKNVFRGDPEHPAVKYLFETAGDYYIGGSLQGLDYPKHYDYVEIRKTPAVLRKEFVSAGWADHNIVAFQTRNPMHRAHRELTIRAAADLENGHILIHPVVGLTKPGDIDHHTRVKVYKQILKKFPDNLGTLSLLPLAMRMGGDKEALWHAIIRQNYGVDHFIVGRDHAGPGKNSHGVDFYGPYDAQELLKKVGDELNIKIVPFRMVTYLPEEDRYAPIDTIDPNTKTANISGTELRNRLRTGDEIPEWFSYPEVVKILRSTNPPRSKQGFAIAIETNKDDTSSAAINNVAYALQSVLNEIGDRRISKLTNYDVFIVNELVKSGSGVIYLTGDVDEVANAVGDGNTVVISSKTSASPNHFTIPTAKDLSEFIATLVNYLKSQGFYN